MILGCDRTLITVSSLFCLFVGFNLGLSRGNFGILGLSIVMWFVIRFGLIQMGKKDPYMLGVFKRSMQYTDGLFHSQFVIPAHESIDTSVPMSAKKRWLAE
jgi:type IV secretory pathway TrbD component